VAREGTVRNTRRAAGHMADMRHQGTNRARCLTCSRLQLETYEHASVFFGGAQQRGALFMPSCAMWGGRKVMITSSAAPVDDLKEPTLAERTARGGARHGGRPSVVAARCSCPRKLAGRMNHSGLGGGSIWMHAAHAKRANPFRRILSPPTPQISG